MVNKTEYKNIQSYITKDGSIIRELMHPDIHGNMKQSPAEAIIPVDGITYLHKHCRSEEIYHIMQGHGLMFLGNEQCKVTVGDTIYIPPDVPHQIKNLGDTPIKILCCSSPPYSHDDTDLVASY